MTIYRKTSLVQKVALLLMALMACMVALSTASKVNALLNPNPVSGYDIPATDYNALYNCENNVPLQSPAYATWVGMPQASGAPATTTFNASYGQSSIFLQWYMSAAICFNGPLNSRGSQWKVEGIEIRKDGVPIVAATSGITGDVIYMNFGSNYSVKDSYFAERDAGGFQVSPSGGFTQTGQYQIILTVKGINQFSSAQQCVGGNEAFTSNWNFGVCNAINTSFLINVNVQPPPISCTLSASSSTIVAGGSTTLTWSTAGSPSSASIDQGIGGVSASGGTRNVSPGGTTTYTMTVSKSGVPNATCSTTVTVSQPACPSYPPYGAFSPMVRNVSLGASGAPGAYAGSPWTTAGPTTSAWSTGSWQYTSQTSTSESQSQSRTRTTTITERRYYYYYTYVNNADGTTRTAVDSVQGTTEWAGENTPYTGGTNGSVELNYTTHYNNYPYDQHQPYINYRVRYDQRRVTQQRTTTITETQTRTRTRNRANSTAAWSAWNTSGWSSSSSTSGSWADLSGSDTSQGQTWTSTQSIAAPFMPPCFPRTYSVSATNGIAQLNSDRESPTNATYNGTISASFSVPNTSQGVDPMRQASRVNGIPYNVTYWVVRANGTSSAVGSIGSTPGSPLNFIATTNNRTSNASSVTVNANYAVSVPAVLQVGDRVCWRLTLPGPISGQMGISGERLTNNGSLTLDPVCTPTVVNWPYMEVLGNDVVGGGSFGNCTSTSNGQIRGHSRAGSFTGSSTQYAAFALGTIQGFTSAALLDNAFAGFFPKWPVGLSFANSSAYGGNYAANDNITCLADYTASKPGNTELVSAANLPTELVITNQKSSLIEYIEVNGDVSLGHLVVPNGVRKVVYINGDLQLSGNAIGEGVVINPNWNDRDEISFVMFVSRNTTIQSSVRRLDGVYVAQNAGGGTIQTCEALDYGSCRAPLTVNGALFAENIRFLRTRGSLSDSRAYEGRTGISVPGICRDNGSSAPISATDTVTGTTCAAEIINFSPELYVVMTNILSPQDNFKLDSYVQLPPNL